MANDHRANDARTRSLGEIAALAGSVNAALGRVKHVEGGDLIRDLAARDRERWGIVYAALSDAQDEGAPGTVAALAAILDAALGDGDDG